MAKPTFGLSRQKRTNVHTFKPVQLGTQQASNPTSTPISVQPPVLTPMADSRMLNTTVGDDRSPLITGKPYGRNIRKIPKPLTADERQAQNASSLSSANSNPMVPLHEATTLVNEPAVVKSRPVVFLLYCYY